MPGQFITLDLPIHDKRINRWRSYSIANLPDEDGLIELCIVNLDGGLASTYLFSEVRQGEVLRFKGPSGSFTLPSTTDQEVVMVCTGTGIAPFRSMILDLKRRGPLQFPIHMIFGTRHLSDVLYREELENLAESEELFKYTIVLSRDQSWTGYKGHVHQVYMTEHRTPQQNKLFLLCGWSMMVDEAVANIILKLGYHRSQVRYELYG